MPVSILPHAERPTGEEGPTRVLRQERALSERVGHHKVAAALAIVVALNLVVAMLSAMSAGAVSPPSVSAVTPNTGSPTGGTVVSISGTGFVPGSTTVSFGTTPGTSVSCSTVTICSATSPAGSTGLVDITVSTAGGTSATVAADHFTYAVFAYVANFGSATVSVINTATNTLAATVPVGSSPGYVAVTPSGAYVYVANQASNSVSVISTATNPLPPPSPWLRTPSGGRHP